MSADDSNERELTVDVLQTKAVVLVDDKGEPRARLSCSSGDNSNSGHVVIHLFDGQGRPRVTLQVDDEEGASISLFNQGNSPCLSLGVLNERGNGVTICDENGLPRITAGFSNSSANPDEQDAEITVRNAEGEDVWTFVEPPGQSQE